MSSFPSEYLNKTVFEFDRSPSTPEKLKISQRYLSDEISVFEFAGQARTYLDSLTTNTEDPPE